MLGLSDNIFLAWICGVLFCMLLATAFYLIAEIFDIRMSGKSLLLSVIMFAVVLFQSSKIAAGFMAKCDVNDGYSYIEEQCDGDVNNIEPVRARDIILTLHPNLRPLVEIVEIPSSYNSKQYFNDLHSTLNLNLWQSVGWLLGSILVCGIPALLLGKRKESTGSRRRHAERRQRVRSMRS